MTEDAAESTGLGAALARLGERGARRVDPVRWHLAEGLLRRAPAHEGAARVVIEVRVATLVESIGAALDAAAADPSLAPAGTTPDRAASPGPLASLVAHAKAHARMNAGRNGDAPEAVLKVPAASSASASARSTSARRPGRRTASTPVPAPTQTPPSLEYFRRTWSRLKADDRLAQARTSLPANAGPLNSHHLVHRALATLHELAPTYFEHVIGHVDDLLWIEAATGAAGPDPTTPGRPESERKGRGR
jgi:hypothetical protein